ncbi:MAG: hypothetical protein QXV23_00540 [Candidatus Bathyarchaeia archaeon]
MECERPMELGELKSKTLALLKGDLEFPYATAGLGRRKDMTVGSKMLNNRVSSIKRAKYLGA